jgi:hypothetical protein
MAKQRMKQNIIRFVGGFLLAGVVCVTGCHTTDQADTGELASVIITGHTEMEIQKATARVFLANGYSQADPLTFEKQGTAWDKAAYGGWTENPVGIKVRVHINPQDDGVCFLGCNAFLVTDPHEAAMEEEQKLSYSRRSECEKILAQIKARLDAPPETPAP